MIARHLYIPDSPVNFKRSNRIKRSGVQYDRKTEVWL